MRVSMALVLIACNNPEDPKSSTSESTGDTAVVDPCIEIWSDGLTEPDAAGPDTQIHGTSVFDGEHLWVAWNRPDSGSQFDIWLQRMACDGTIDVGPFEVTNTDDNELDPVLAVSGDRLMVAWSSDNGQSPNNLDIRSRVYDLSGIAVSDAIDLAAERGTTPVTGNAWFPDLAATPDGFLLSGSWGHDDATTFQAFTVPIGPDGNPTEPATDGQLDTSSGQLYSAIAYGDATTFVLWQEDSTPPVIEGGPLGDPAPIAAPAARPDVSHGPDGFWQAWDSDDGDVHVKTPDGGTVGISGLGFEHSPSLVAIDGGAIVLTMEIVDGIANRIRVRHLDVDGSVSHEETLQTESAVSIYGVDLTLVDDRHAVVVYQDGENPAFRLKAEWITLP